MSLEWRRDIVSNKWPRKTSEESQYAFVDFVADCPLRAQEAARVERGETRGSLPLNPGQLHDHVPPGADDFH
jgi:hypothetical protein